MQLVKPRRGTCSGFGHSGRLPSADLPSPPREERRPLQAPPLGDRVAARWGVLAGQVGAAKATVARRGVGRDAGTGAGVFGMGLFCGLFAHGRWLMRPPRLGVPGFLRPNEWEGSGWADEYQIPGPSAGEPSSECWTKRIRVGCNHTSSLGAGRSVGEAQRSMAFVPSADFSEGGERAISPRPSPR
jgi:hypothetical protein